MAISPANMNGSAQKPAAFSYAQAAKGKPTPPPTPARISDALLKESTSWADDSADSNTMIDEPQTNGLSNGIASASEPSVNGSLTQAHTEGSSTSINASHPASPAYESTATTAKDDESDQPTKVALDGAWETKSQAWSASDSKGEAADDTQQRPKDGGNDGKESRRGSTRKDSSTAEEPKTYKEAPIPMVNIWQKRAQDAQSKQPSIKPASSPVAASTPQDKSIAEKQTLSNQRRTSGNEPVSRDVALPRSNKTRSDAPSRVGKPEAASPSQAVPPPPTGDATAWPTPLTAQEQEEERRKASEKGDKDRTAPASTKTHTKKEWSTVAFTPSVKFETPLPIRGGRGGRIGARGGRGGSLSERGGLTSGARESSTMDKPETEQRTGFVGTSRNTSPPIKTAVAGAENELTLKEPSPSASTTQQKRGSVPEDATSTSNGSRFASTRQSTRSQEQKPSIANTEDLSRLSQGGEEVSQKREFTRRRSLVSLADNNGGETTVARPHRKTNGYVGDPRGNSQEMGYGSGRRSPTDGRSRAPSIHFDNYNQGTSFPAGRGRGERGRGRGRGGFQAASHTLQGPNGQLPLLQTSSPNKNLPSQPHSAPLVPPYETRRQQSSRSGPRAASIPNDVPYNRYNGPYSTNPMYAPGPISPLMSGGIFDYGMVPRGSMDAMAHSPYSPNPATTLYNTVAAQLSYYFSLNNVLKDEFLRQHMDSQGFVALSLIAGFARMKQICSDTEFIKHVCLQHPELEARFSLDGQLRVRMRHGWEQWVLEMSARDKSAQNDGPPSPPPEPQMAFQPQSVMRPPVHSPMHQGMQSGMENGLVSPPHRIMASGFTPNYSPVHTASPFLSPRSPRDSLNRHSFSALDGAMPGQHSRQVSSTSVDISTSGLEQDDFPNDQISTLVVGVKMQINGMRSEEADLRTVSSSSANLESPQERQCRPAQNSEKRNASNQRVNAVVRPNADGVNVFWLKGEEDASSSLPASDGDVRFIPYHELREEAYMSINELNETHTPYHMQVLLDFWTDFLVRNFNTTMYNDFKALALEDPRTGQSEAALEHLRTYYHDAFKSEKRIHRRVAQDYVELVKYEDTSKGRPAFAQMKRVYRNGTTNAKNMNIISKFLNQQLKADLG